MDQEQFRRAAHAAVEDSLLLSAPAARFVDPFAETDVQSLNIILLFPPAPCFPISNLGTLEN
jgi:hypothetical protein